MMMCAPPSRRELFVAAAAFSGACGRARRQSDRLTYLLPYEPDTLDPAKTPGGSEIWMMSALFEPLLQPHPETAALMAGLATHFKVERGGTRYTFYLRGHPAPDGLRLAGTESLPAEFSRVRAGAPYDVPACWSDGTPVTAHDIVYSWRRYLAPETGNPNANSLYCIAGAEAVCAGKLSPEELGVCATDELTFQVDLQAPAPNFPMLCYSWMALPLPRHAIEAARRRGREASWTEPGQMLSSGPFVLKESRPHERTVLAKNPNYFDSNLVGVEEIQFFAADGVTVLNLFEAGLADSMEGRVLPRQFVPRMRSKAAFHMAPACASHNWRISAKRPPLDNLLLRYALNMATDKDTTARFLGAGQTPARSRVPPLDGYRSAESLLVQIHGRPCDVLAYDPQAARELWAAAAPAEARLPLPIHYLARADSRLLAEILQHQWRENLGLQTKLMPQESAAYIRTILTDGDYTGVAEEPYVANYPDPYDLLSLYTAGFANWSDPEFDRMLTAATSIADAALRMEKLADCETALLRAMPFVPLYFDTWVYLERPEVHGLSVGPMGYPAFKYAWIDTNRRPQ
jgi:oligopeptide transport system substrate-binding protein